MALQQIFYVSRASSTYDMDSIKSILAQSRRNNQRDDVTGCLLFSGCYFGQVLEGTPAAVAKSLRRIEGDERHQDFRMLAERHLGEREYGEWSMGYLHSLDLEDDLEALLKDAEPDPDRVLAVMNRMRPDEVMGSIR